MNNLTVEEVFEAYYECRKSKRYSYGALSFEANYEENLLELYTELKNQTWKCGKSTCFIVNEPVKREIFAAPFRDRIVHHILMNRLNPYFEKYFINDSYACRTGKGTHAAIQRAAHFVRSVSCNNTKEVVFNDVCKDCMIRSPLKEWDGQPEDKSLFTAKSFCGLPIGNLTSQVFANFYLSEFDHFIKHTLKIKNYVRYVDDFIIVHEDKKYLKNLIPVIRRFLKNKLLVILHPKKIFLQNAKKGFQYLGCFIKPEFITVNKRIRKNFTESLKIYSLIAKANKPSNEIFENMLASFNSYLGIMVHYKAWKFKTKQIKYYFEPYLKKHFSVKLLCDKVERA